MKQIWLIFAQAVTVAVAALFVVSTLKPHWLAQGDAQAAPVVKVAPPPAARAKDTLSYADAAQTALPAVVNIAVTVSPDAARVRLPNPLLDDPFFRRFFEFHGGMNDNAENAPNTDSAEEDGGDGADSLPPEDGAEEDGFGSGVIVSTDGYVLTNNHVIENGDRIEVSLNDGRKFPAKLVGTDPETDVAVLKIDTREALPAITFAHNEGLRIGDVVLAIGNPFGVGQTVTMGIVSALGRNELGLSTFENYIQTDAAINPGNSGGALVDTSGNLVGINTAIFSRSGGSLGIGFAIPVSLARHVMDEIIAHGSVTRGWIGVEIQEMTPELADSFHTGEQTVGKTLVSGVLTRSPAFQAGVEPGDILIAIDGQPIGNPKDMQTRVAAIPPGQTTQFTFLRNGKEIRLPIEIARRPMPQDMKR